MSDLDTLLQGCSTSLFKPESLDDVRDRLDYIEEHECNCNEGPHENALHDLAHDDVPILLELISLLWNDRARLLEVINRGCQ